MRWAMRLVAAVGLAAAIVAVIAWLTIRASLPQIDGEVAVSGISAVALIGEGSDCGGQRPAAGRAFGLGV